MIRWPVYHRLAGLTFGTQFDPRQVPALFAPHHLPITFPRRDLLRLDDPAHRADRRVPLAAGARDPQPTDLHHGRVFRAALTTART